MPSDPIPPQHNIWDHFQQLSLTLQSQSGGLRRSPDPLTRGVSREVLIANVLQAHLPKKVIIGKGEIVDCLRYISRPIDLILYRDDAPVFDLGGGAQQYLVEGVQVTVEVKSHLSASELDRALDQVGSVKRAKRMHATDEMREWYRRQYGDESQAYKYLDKVPPGPSTSIFAFDGTSLKALVARAQRRPLTDLPDFICVLGRGAVRLDSTALRYEQVADELSPLLAFFFFVLTAVTHNEQRYSWDWYVAPRRHHRGKTASS